MWSQLKRLVLLAGALAALVLAACAGSGDADGDGRLRVVATTTQIGDFARNVGGDRINLTVLLGPNQDAHDFELEPSQIRAVVQADLVLRNGLGLDDFLDNSLDQSDAQTATLTDGIQPRAGHDDEGEGADPHVWFSVANARRMVENLRDALVSADAANAEAYRRNATAYLQELDALESEVRAAVEEVPPACRKLVTNHGVLGYFADAYGFELAASVLPGSSSESGASASRVAEIARLVQDEGIPAIFAEGSENTNLLEQVAREAGVTVVRGLYGDFLGPAGSDGATYVEMMRSNTQKIVGALKDCPAAR